MRPKLDTVDFSNDIAILPEAANFLFAEGNSIGAGGDCAAQPRSKDFNMFWCEPIGRERWQEVLEWKL
jgi:hypothetical protein